MNEVVQSYDFSLALSKTSLSMPSGDYSNVSVTVTPIGGFKGNVSLGCEGLPEYALCVFPHGSSISLANGAKEVTLSVNASNVYGYGNNVSRSVAPSTGEIPRALRRVFLVPMFFLFGFTARRRGYVKGLGLTGLALTFTLAASLLNGCSGKLPGKTAPGIYTLTVAGASSDGASLKHSVPLQLTVAP